MIQRIALTLCLGLLPGVLCADEGMGWPWRSCADCPRGQYSILHYWTPTWYKVRAHVHPSYLDQYAPGTGPIQPMFDVQRQRCPTLPPMPSAPYADPASYFGRAPRPPLTIP